MKIKSQITSYKTPDGQTEWQLKVDFSYSDPLTLSSSRLASQTYIGFQSEKSAKEYLKVWKEVKGEVKR